MHPNKIIIVEVISFVVLYVLVYNIAPKLNSSPGGDAAGEGMGKGLLMLAIIAAFLFVAITLTVINYFVLKGVSIPAIKVLAYLPLCLSVAHILYIFLFT